MTAESLHDIPGGNLKHPDFMDIQMISTDNDLMKALYSEYLEAIKTSLKNNADVNKPYNANGYKFVILFTKFVKRTNIRKNLVSKPNFYKEQ